MAVPLVSGLTLSQIQSCERFSLAVWGDTFFDYRPTHRGQHGYMCSECLPVLVEAEQKPLEAPVQPRQPWEAREAA